VKIKKYTNGAWADLDKPVKKFATYTDEATTLPLTIEASATNAVENYQVYGRTVVNLADAILEHANISGDGTIIDPGLVDPEEDKYVLYIAPVESGKTYTITTSEYDSAIVYAFYSTQPAYGVPSYNNARTVLQSEHQATITAPITGWIAFRDHITAPAGMIVEGSAPAPIYVPPGAKGGVGEETENLVTEIIQNATINSAGTLVTSSTYNVSIAPITAGTTYTLSRDYNYTVGTTHYAFFANLPAKGSTSYDGNRNSVEQVNVTFTAPITGYVVLLNKEGKSTAVEGNTAIPYGYKIPLTITSGKPNLVSDIINNAYVNSSGVFATNSSLNAAVTPIERNKMYTVLKARTGGNMFCGFFGSYPVIGASTYDGNRISFGVEYCTFTAPITGYLVSSCQSSAGDPIVYEGEYHPRESIETPLYIGGTQLGEDEYLDYGEQKIYKDVSGTLTPTDPPIPFPTLTTYLGENSIDVDTTTPPDKVVLEYKGWKGIGEPQIYDGGEWKDEPSEDVNP